MWFHLYLSLPNSKSDLFNPNRNTGMLKNEIINFKWNTELIIVEFLLCSHANVTSQSILEYESGYGGRSHIKCSYFY